MWDVVHEITGPQRVVGPLFQMSETPPSVQGASPALGRDTLQLLAEAGFSGDEIDGLLHDGVVRVFGAP